MRAVAGKGGSWYDVSLRCARVAFLRTVSRLTPYKDLAACGWLL